MRRSGLSFLTALLYRVAAKPITVVYFLGNGGQMVSMDRENDVMTVVTAGNYNKRGYKKQSWEIYPDVVFPALTNAKAASPPR